MAVLTLTQRLLNPDPDAPYSVRDVAIPASGLNVPQALIDRFHISPQQAEALHTRAAHAQQPGTFFAPRTWSGAAVLLIPGAGDNRHAFKWLILRALMDRKLAVLTVDPPGHGQFTQVPCTIDNVRHAARNWSDWLHAQSGVRCVGAIGISFGGCQAIDLAVHDPRISAVATIATPVHLPNVTRGVVARESLMLLLPRNVSLLKFQSLRKMWREWRSMNGAWFGEGLYDMIERFDVANTVHALGQRPTMFVHGKRDCAVPPTNAQKLFDAAVPDRELLWVPHASHLSVVLYEKEMARLAAWMAHKLEEKTAQQNG
jgi:pimeloyl-ACP methyl ester carboxylesterase